MNGLQIHGVTLFLGKIQGRKQECFYFMEGNTQYPVAYIRRECLADAKRLWGTFIGETDEKTNIH